MSSQALSGKTVVLSFWATWCKPCRKELPALQQLYSAHYAGRAGVRFFLVNENRGPAAAAKAKAWLRRHGVTLPSALDRDGSVYRKLTRAAVLPVRVVIGPRGGILLRTVGYSAEDAGFPALRSTLAESLKAASD